MAIRASRALLPRAAAVSVAAVSVATLSVGPGVAYAAPAPGALLSEFLGNQVENCAAICPYAITGLQTLPAAVLGSPVALATALAVTGSPLQALGSAAATVTGPANDAMAGIIGNDLDRVVPRFQNGVLIGEVDLMKLAGAALVPAAAPGSTVPGAVDTLRSDVLTALQQPLPPAAPVPPPLTTPAPFGILPSPAGPLQAGAVEATDAFFAVAFYAPELSLLGVTQTADAAATTLRDTGSPGASLTAAGSAARRVVDADASILRGATSTTVTDAIAPVRDSSHPPRAGAGTHTAPGGFGRSPATAPRGPVAQTGPAGRDPSGAPTSLHATSGSRAATGGEASSGEASNGETPSGGQAAARGGAAVHEGTGAGGRR
ncbi:hypothetical protein P0W64_18975 [Tsukamurella sp. 8F]|uniref:hypothetical protein n=1 Tax=unclassified Tsukamurella TaxID=2633480 RepID=UPI0023B98759|nr:MULTISPECIES: hypothetical protein [unclassified Tsukamurella]MDF0531969.1 hypothetical protein [Tsukamurella sp. 8J]MDF0588868.1 hypothetical protein [Tsukamurella sp. 8F]